MRGINQTNRTVHRPSPKLKPARESMRFLQEDSKRREAMTQSTVEAIKHDICQWMAALNLCVRPESFLDDLSNGTVLCRLLEAIVPATKKKIFENAKPGSFQARDNIVRFVEWMKAHNLSRFETDDVALGTADEGNFLLRQKIVAYSLLDIGRYAGQQGFTPLPQLVVFEMEIDQEKGEGDAVAPVKARQEGSQLDCIIQIAMDAGDINELGRLVAQAETEGQMSSVIYKAKTMLQKHALEEAARAALRAAMSSQSIPELEKALATAMDLDMELEPLYTQASDLLKSLRQLSALLRLAAERPVTNLDQLNSAIQNAEAMSYKGAELAEARAVRDEYVAGSKANQQLEQAIASQNHKELESALAVAQHAPGSSQELIRQAKQMLDLIQSVLDDLKKAVKDQDVADLTYGLLRCDELQITGALVDEARKLLEKLRSERDAKALVQANRDKVLADLARGIADKDLQGLEVALSRAKDLSLTGEAVYTEGMALVQLLRKQAKIRNFLRLAVDMRTLHGLDEAIAMAEEAKFQGPELDSAVATRKTMQAIADANEALQRAILSRDEQQLQSALATAAGIQGSSGELQRQAQEALAQVREVKDLLAKLGAAVDKGASGSADEVGALVCRADELGLQEEVVERARALYVQLKKEETQQLLLSIDPGMYLIQNKKVYIRIVGVHIMVRTGGGWQALQEWLSIMYGADSEMDISDIFSTPVASGPGKAAPVAKGPPKGKITVKDILEVSAVFTKDLSSGKRRVSGKAAAPPLKLE